MGRRPSHECALTHTPVIASTALVRGKAYGIESCFPPSVWEQSDDYRPPLLEATPAQVCKRPGGATRRVSLHDPNARPIA